MSKNFKMTESFIAGVKKLFPEDKGIDEQLKQAGNICEIKERLREERLEMLKRDIRTHQIRAAFNGHEKAKEDVLKKLDRLELIENLLDESHWWGWD